MAFRPSGRSVRRQPNETSERSRLFERLRCRPCCALPSARAGGGSTGEGAASTPAPRRRQKRRRRDRANPAVIALTPEILDRVRLAPRTIAPADPGVGLALLRAAVRGGAAATGAVIGEWLVGVALAAPTRLDGVDELVALGVAPASRRGGLATALLRSSWTSRTAAAGLWSVLHTAAERDPVRPAAQGGAPRTSPRAWLVPPASRFDAAPSDVAAADPSSRSAIHLPPGRPGRPRVTGRRPGWPVADGARTDAACPPPRAVRAVAQQPSPLRRVRSASRFQY